jgi:hypothetical protein
VAVSGKDVTIPETTINDTMYLGGLTLDDSTIGYFKVTSSDLATKTTLKLYYPSYHPEELMFVEDLQVLNEIQNVTESNPQSFVPEFE